MCIHWIYNILKTDYQQFIDFRFLLKIHFPSFHLTVTMVEKRPNHLVKYTSIIPQKQRKYSAIILQTMIKLEFF